MGSETPLDSINDSTSDYSLTGGCGGISVDLLSSRIETLGHSDVQRLEMGAPILLPAHFSHPRIPADLRAVVEKWPVHGWGRKHPSWSILTKQVHPNPLRPYTGQSDFIDILQAFQQAAEDAILRMVPAWRGALTPDRVSWRPLELSTRRVRWNARDDLFHIDHFPTRPTGGRRIVRFFFNACDGEDIVWSSTSPLKKLIEDGKAFGQPQVFQDMAGLRRQAVRNQPWWSGFQRQTGLHDAVVKLVHDHLKRDETFQEETVRKLRCFTPGSAWFALTDSCCHALLRGRWLVDITWFLEPDACQFPDLLPTNLLGTVSSPRSKTLLPLDKAA